jgi:PPOX class probable F420-dependent enzyme
MRTIPESHQDLLDGQVATLATIDDAGFPQLTEVWFLYDDGELKISLNSGRSKTENLERRPECSVVLLDLQNPYRYVEIRGRARIERDVDYSLADKVGAKYGVNLREYDRPGQHRVTVTIDPVKVHAVDMSS